MVDIADIKAETGFAPAATDEDLPGEGTDTSFKEKSKFGVMFWLPAGWLLLVLFCALFGPFLPLKAPNTSDPCAQYVGPVVDLSTGQTTIRHYAPGTVIDGVDVSKCTPDSKPAANPSTLHPLGTDAEGRDTLARLVAGAKVTMIAGFVTIAIGLAIGGTVGLIAGYFRGKVEVVLMSVVDIMLAFPTLVLALAIVAVLGRGLTNACIAITVVAIPAFARITRANTLAYSEREFVTAARVMGAKHYRIMTKEILPNVLLPVISFAILAVGVAIVAEGSLAFLSLSVKDPQSSWGTMINDGRGVLQQSPLVALIPSAALLITVLALNVLGEKFRQIFNVKDASL